LALFALGAERTNPATVFSKSLMARVSDACALARVVLFLAAMMSSEDCEL
jgi:hypothetical protein